MWTWLHDLLLAWWLDPLLTIENHSKLEAASWVAQVGILFVGTIGAILAVNQLRALKEQAKASFLFELDKMWESTDFAVARSKFDEMRKKTEDTCHANFPHLDDGGKEDKITELVAIELNKLRDEKLTEYTFIMKLCGFYETAGMLVDRKYVAFEDINGLYGGSIVRLYSTTKTHIKKRAAEMPPGYLEYFCALAKRAEASAPRAD